MPLTLPFDNSYARLPGRFYARVAPTKVRAPRIIKVNHALATALGLDPAQLDTPEGAEILVGNVVPEGAASIALAYAGHQFGGFVPQLGDGRAILLGEVLEASGARRDIQLKGSGPTPFSRRGDGRAALGPVLREYIVSEAMAALGIPTTRALAAVSTGETVVREQPLPGAVLTRVAASHLRVGTFEFFAARDDREALSTLVGYALERHYPLARGEGPSPTAPARSPNGEKANDALLLLDCVVQAQASLVARWLGVGFVHGVMNTDNTSISGETIDFGPCAFLDEYDPNKTFSSIDTGGRYAFGNQPRVAQWNLARFAETILPLIHRDADEAANLAMSRLEQFTPRFETAYAQVMRAKLGFSLDDENDPSLAADLLRRLAASEVDYTIFFRRLSAAAESASADSEVASLFRDPSDFHSFAETWRRRLQVENVAPATRAAGMRQANPAFIPRNHRIEEAIRDGLRGDFTLFETLVQVLARPYDDQPGFAYLAEAPHPSERVTQTFCGT